MTKDPPCIFTRGSYQRPATSGEPTAAISWRIYIGAPDPSEPGFYRAAPFRGVEREAQDEADRMSEGKHQPYIVDVMTDAVWTRPPGGAWGPA